MLCTHGLMRDGAPGEITPGAAAPGPERIYRKISAEAKRYAGPYKIEIKIPGKVKVGRRTKARIRVLSSWAGPSPTPSCGSPATTQLVISSRLDPVLLLNSKRYQFQSQLRPQIKTLTSISNQRVSKSSSSSCGTRFGQSKEHNFDLAHSSDQMKNLVIIVVLAD